MITQHAPHTRHLVGLWNPARAENALDASVQMLLQSARQDRAGELQEDDVYVWWGKAISQGVLRDQSEPSRTVRANE